MDFNTALYINRVYDLDVTDKRECEHEENVLIVLKDMLKDGAPLWAVKKFLEFVG